MKTTIKILFIVSMSLMLFSACRPSRMVVRERPVAPYMERPMAPYPNYVYIDGEWSWRGGRYEYVHPHYVAPRRGRAWVPGHWTTSRRGNVWMKGRWR